MAESPVRSQRDYHGMWQRGKFAARAFSAGGGCENGSGRNTGGRSEVSGRRYRSAQDRICQISASRSSRNYTSGSLKNRVPWATILYVSGCCAARSSAIMASSAMELALQVGQNILRLLPGLTIEFFISVTCGCFSQNHDATLLPKLVRTVGPFCPFLLTIRPVIFRGCTPTRRSIDKRPPHPLM
jgi:hypothetical protein